MLRWRTSYLMDKTHPSLVYIFYIWNERICTISLLLYYFIILFNILCIHSFSELLFRHLCLLCPAHVTLRVNLCAVFLPLKPRHPFKLFMVFCSEVGSWAHWSQEVQYIFSIQASWEQAFLICNKSYLERIISLARIKWGSL